MQHETILKQIKPRISFFHLYKLIFGQKRIILCVFHWFIEHFVNLSNLTEWRAPIYFISQLLGPEILSLLYSRAAPDLTKKQPLSSMSTVKYSQTSTSWQIDWQLSASVTLGMSGARPPSITLWLEVHPSTNFLPCIIQFVVKQLRDPSI